MLDLRSIVTRGSRGRLVHWTQAALAATALLLAAMACVSASSFFSSAEAHSSNAELNSMQRRLLAARLKDRLKALERDVERSRQRVRADLTDWMGEEPSRLTELFDGKKPVRSIPDVAENIYEKIIKEYVAFERNNQPTWNPWPKIGTRPYPDQVEDITISDQRKYANCVLSRIDYYFKTKWEYLKLVINAVEQNGSPPQLNEDGGVVTTLRRAIRAALTFDGGIAQYLGNVPISQELTRRSQDDQVLDPLRKCPVEFDMGGESDTAVSTLPLSVEWNAKCLQSDILRPDGKVKPYHPTTAALMYDNGRTGFTTYCSGTLIAPNAVLTAAHCICETAAKEPRGQFYQTAAACVAGGYSRLGRGVSTLDPRHQIVFLQHAGLFDVSQIVVHPEFRWTSDLPSADLAILFLRTPVPGIVPMTLNYLRKLPPNTKAAAVGYGAHNPIGATGSITDTATVLEQAGLKLRADTVTGFCSQSARSRKLICWSYRAGRSGMNLGSTCRGDSGGPLYAESGNQTYLVGVTSGGGPSCQPNTEAYDTEVYSYREWILKQLASNTPPPQRGGRLRLPSVGQAGDHGMTQLACHFCSLCDQLEATIKTPGNARHVQISVNCTPDEVDRRGELNLVVSGGDDGNRCSTTGPIGTVASCAFPVAPNQELKVKLNTGLLQQCQIVATSFNRRD